MSVWQMPVATSRTRTSSGRGSSSVTVSRVKGPPIPRATAAVISMACSLRRLLEAECGARFGWRRDFLAHDLDDARGLFDERGVARSKLAAGEVEVVLHADAHMAAKQQRLRHRRKLVRADAEGEPCGVMGQEVAHVE